MRGPPRRTSERRFVPQRLRRKVPNPNGRRVGARAPTWACAIRAAPGLGPARTQRSDLSSLSCTAPLSDSSWFSSKLATTSSPPLPFLPFRPPLVLLTSQIEILLPPRLGFRFLPRPSTTQAAAAAVAAWKQSHLVALDFPAAARLSFLFARSPAGPPIA